MTASLYIVATPIGNLGDMTLRGLETLREVDLIAAEDTRHSAKLLAHFDIRTPMVSYHDHSTSFDIEQLLRRLRAGESIALISDAGTPMVSDPGYRLVAACRAESLPVVPIPGPSSMTAALSVAGLPSDRFHFEGFLPVKLGQRSRRLTHLRSYEATLIFFESPRRLVGALEMMCSELGDREAALCRELTKSHETIRSEKLSVLLEFVRSDANQQRGEVVILVRGFAQDESDVAPETWLWLERLARELPPRRAAAIVADITGLSARDLYQWLLEHRQEI